MINDSRNAANKLIEIYVGGTSAFHKMLSEAMKLAIS